MAPSLLEEVEEVRARVTARGDAWRERLEHVHGKVGHDGVERIPTQALFDILQISQRGRASGTSRRLARVMTELGWRAVRFRELTRQGFKDKVRGYARLSGR